MAPEYLSRLTRMLAAGTELYRQRHPGAFPLPEPADLLRELMEELCRLDVTSMQVGRAVQALDEEPAKRGIIP